MSRQIPRPTGKPATFTSRKSLRSPLALVGVVLQLFWPSFMSQPQLIDGSCNTYSIFFDSCLGEERSLFEFEVVTLREPPGRDPSLLFDFHPYIWYVESLVKSTLLDRVCFNFTLDSCRVARLTSGRVNERATIIKKAIPFLFFDYSLAVWNMDQHYVIPTSDNPSRI